MVDMASVRSMVDDRRDEFLEVLFRLLRQPSISTQGIGVDECAELVLATLEENGIAGRIIPTAGLPVVYAERMAGDDANTILIYGHYDVQPPEPYEEWVSPPFEPTIRDGRIYARGVGDNKGQFLAHILAIRVLDEKCQEIELQCGQLDRLPVHPRLTPVEVNPYPPRLPDPGSVRTVFRPAEHGPHPGLELAGAERLRHVVVGAQLQAQDTIVLRRPRRKHDDRHSGPAANEASNIEAIHSGEHQVENHEVWGMGRCLCEGLGPVRCHGDREPRALQVAAHELSHPRVIVHHQNPLQPSLLDQV